MRAARQLAARGSRSACRPHALPAQNARPAAPTTSGRVQHLFLATMTTMMTQARGASTTWTLSLATGSTSVLARARVLSSAIVTLQTRTGASRATPARASTMQLPELVVATTTMTTSATAPHQLDRAVAAERLAAQALHVTAPG